MSPIYFRQKTITLSRNILKDLTSQVFYKVGRKLRPLKE